MPIALNIYSNDGNSCYIYKNKSSLMNSIKKEYGGFNEITDNGNLIYGIMSKSGIGEYYLIRDNVSKGGWKWQDVNGEDVPSDKTGHSSQMKDFRK